MSDPISVCNEAIGELGGGEFGAPRLQAFDEGTNLASLCGDFYPSSRDLVLELHPWNFATVFARLVRSPGTPDMKWTYMYALPTEPYCLTVRATDQPVARWDKGTTKTGERVVFSNAPTLAIEYTKRVEDLGSWDAIALQVLVKVLASKLAKPLTGQNSLTQLKMQEAMALLPEARQTDAQEAGPRILRPNRTLVHARHRWGGSWPNPERTWSDW